MNPSALTVIIVGGGQSGLAAAKAALDAGLRPVVLEGQGRTAGSWSHYYDSLTLFSPAQYSSFPGFAFPGDPDAYPTRDDVTAYVSRYAETLDVQIRTGARVIDVESDGVTFTVHTADGDAHAAAGVIAASGSFGNPHLPALPGQEEFTGTVSHVASYRNPSRYAGQRVVVVGAGNSAIQVAYELAHVASVTLATRSPVHFTSQRHLGRDLHYWLTTTRLDLLPPAWLARMFSHTLVIDTGDYRAALDSGLFDRRPMFSGFDGDRVIWADGAAERVDAVLFATGYRPDLGYLRKLGALDGAGRPLHAGGLSTSHVGLAYLGLEFQRSFSSNTLRGVHRDAAHVMAPMAAHVTGAATAFASKPATMPRPAA